MTKIFIAFLVFLTSIFSGFAFSENLKTELVKDITISGKIIDKETKQPLEYATIAFFSKSENKIVDGCITDANGEFSISINRGVYDITIEYISYKKISILNKNLASNENLGTISLEIDYESLKAVEVIAEKTTVEIKLDKKIYNVGKDLTVSGGTVSDVLDNVPSVSVDGEGNVALRGNTNVQILINGKPSGLVGLNSTDALKQLPAESIEKVEVITSPSARYEAEGTAGIINIILRRSKLQGFNGALTSNIGSPNAAGISGNINYRIKDINFFNTTSYRYRESPGYWYNNTLYKNTGNYLDEKRDWTDINKGLTTNLGLEWYINKTASITTSILYNNGDDENNSINKLLQYDSNRLLLDETNRLDPEKDKDKTIQYSFNYTKDFKTSGHKLTFDFQYEDSNEDKFSLVNQNGINTDKVITLDSQTNILLRTDYVLPIGEKSQFEAGYRGDFTNKSTDYSVSLLNTTTNQLELNTDLSNLFNFSTYINAAYTQFGSKIDKFSYLLGLRMENTRITLDQPTSGDFKKKNYTGLFPTANLSYELSDSENLTFGYNRRLRRPRGFFLNPFPSRSSLTNVFQGNPDLDPTYSDNFDLGYLKRYGKITISSSIFYQYAQNVIEFVSRESGEMVYVGAQLLPVILRGPVNIATNNIYGLEFNLNYNPSKKWRINSDLNLNQEKVRGDFMGTNFNSDNFNWSIRVNNKYTLPGKIDWQTNIRYRGPNQSAQSKNKGRISLNTAISKDVLKDKASISFNVNNLFNNANAVGTIETETFLTQRKAQYRGARSYNLSFTYRFNQKKKNPEFGNGGNGGGDMDI